MCFAAPARGDYSSGLWCTRARVRAAKIGSKFTRVPGRAATSLGLVSSGPRPSPFIPPPPLSLSLVLSGLPSCSLGLFECVPCASSSAPRGSFSRLSGRNPGSLGRRLPLSAAEGRKKETALRWLERDEFVWSRYLPRSLSFSRANDSHAAPRDRSARSLCSLRTDTPL